MRKIAIFMEKQRNHLHPVGLELLSEVRHQLADAYIMALFLTNDSDALDIEKMSDAGANEVLVITNERFIKYDTNDYAEALNHVLENYDFDVVLFGSTIIGRDLAPRISAIRHVGLTADATILEFEQTEDKVLLLATRPALGGNIFATIIAPTKTPQMATIRPGVFEIKTFKMDTKVTEINYTIQKASKVEYISSRPSEKSHANLNQARIIFAGGRGVATKFQTLKQLAVLTGGEVAASRAVVDQNIEPKDRLVGQTGQTVKPSVYVASGISGAVQHIAGMDKSELIIAINTDPKAKIFDIADVSIISDANKVLPLLHELLKKKLT